MNSVHDSTQTLQEAHGYLWRVSLYPLWVQKVVVKDLGSACYVEMHNKVLLDVNLNSSLFWSVAIVDTNLTYVIMTRTHHATYMQACAGMEHPEIAE